MLAPIKASFSTLSIDPPFLSDPRRIFTIPGPFSGSRQIHFDVCRTRVCLEPPPPPSPCSNLFPLNYQFGGELTTPLRPHFSFSSTFWKPPACPVVIKFFFSFIFVTMPWVSCCRWIFSTICYLVAARAGAWTRQRRREKEFFKIWFAHRISNYFLRDLIHIYMCVTDFPFIEWRAVDQRSKSTA